MPLKRLYILDGIVQEQEQEQACIVHQTIYVIEFTPSYDSPLSVYICNSSSCSVTIIIISPIRYKSSLPRYATCNVTAAASISKVFLRGTVYLFSPRLCDRALLGTPYVPRSCAHTPPVYLGKSEASFSNSVLCCDP